jgi:hypothetical protein
MMNLLSHRINIDKNMDSELEPELGVEGDSVR